MRIVDLYDPGITQRYIPPPEELLEIEARLQAITNSIPANVIAHGADRAHNTGVTGAGVKVCVLSDGVDSLATEVAAGRLPAGIDVVAGQAGMGNEGTAMLELVYQIAPGAALGFATGFNGDVQMAANIQALHNAPQRGADYWSRSAAKCSRCRRSLIASSSSVRTISGPGPPIRSKHALQSCSTNCVHSVTSGLAHCCRRSAPRTGHIRMSFRDGSRSTIGFGIRRPSTEPSISRPYLLHPVT